jgi:hypothetical protein
MLPNSERVSADDIEYLRADLIMDDPRVKAEAAQLQMVLEREAASCARSDARRDALEAQLAAAHAALAQLKEAKP